ncbi:hypothetical protein [Flavobacterium sp. T12S277]|uniref:hypothetical protein n=1 Tax=Flavobacterium sp. T12S277 TaxID=3402752 RepID=UPI003AEC94BB
MKKLIPIILFIFFHNIILSQNSIPFKYINKFYDEINFEEYENNKIKLSDFGNSIKINIENAKKNDSVNIKSKIEFSSKNKKYLVLKFKEIGQNEKIDFLCFENNTPVGLPYPYSSILKLQGKFLIEFYSSENNSKYVEINKLKPLAKDPDGSLNIFKLADIIEKNKASLSKYLDQ